jgi:hypothetical protein
VYFAATVESGESRSGCGSGERGALSRAVGKDMQGVAGFKGVGSRLLDPVVYEGVLLLFRV